MMTRSSNTIQLFFESNGFCKLFLIFGKSIYKKSDRHRIGIIILKKSCNEKNIHCRTERRINKGQNQAAQNESLTRIEQRTQKIIQETW